MSQLDIVSSFVRGAPPGEVIILPPPTALEVAFDRADMGMQLADVIAGKRPRAMSIRT